MKKFLNSKFLFAMLFGASVFAWTGCEPLDPEDETTEEGISEALGWFGIGDPDNPDEDLSGIEDDISLGSGDVPSSVDLTNNMPSIGNQGAYGTCVAWAVGYGHKSYMNKVSGDGSTTFSAKYLFWSIPNSSKGSDCGGTGFEAAYDIMLNKGIATESDVPYTDLGDCSSSASSWDGQASPYKIENYRQIDKDVSSLKKYLAQGRAISFGAKLGDEFMNANDASILSSQTYGYSGQHAYHAMILVGYDDSKGSNGAFRVQNSWGSGWGDNGFIWVDQNFFSSDDFCFCAFVATNASSTAPVDDGSNVIDDDDLASGADLMPHALKDENDGGDLERKVTYDVYNSGSSMIAASNDWNILYLYYNVTDADDYGVIIYDYYSDDYGVEGVYEQGPNGNNDELTSGGHGAFNWWNNVNVPSGMSVADALYNDTDFGGFEFRYDMPQISGDYYLLLIADGYDVIKETDESNNYYFLTDADGGGLTFENGVMKETPAKRADKSFDINNTTKLDYMTARTKQNKNTYSPDEIRAMIKHQKSTGELQAKVDAYLKSGKRATKVRARR